MPDKETDQTNDDGAGEGKVGEGAETGPPTTLAGYLALNEEDFAALPDEVRLPAEEAREAITAATTTVREEIEAGDLASRRTASAERAAETSRDELHTYYTAWETKRTSKKQADRDEYEAHMADQANKEKWTRGGNLHFDLEEQGRSGVAMGKVLDTGSIGLAGTDYAALMPLMDDPEVWKPILEEAKDLPGGYWQWFAQKAEAIGFAKGKTAAEAVSAEERARDEQQRSGADGRGAAGRGGGAGSPIQVDFSQAGSGKKALRAAFAAQAAKAG